MGPLKDLPGVVVACGFSGGGFKLAPLTGDIVADHVLAGGTTRDVAFMLPDRRLAQA